MQKLNFDRIISYGCSITSGFELGDVIITDIDVDTYKRKSSIQHWIECLKEKNVLEKVDMIGRQIAWPKYIAKHYNVELDNRAIVGGSIQSTVYQIEHDLINNKINDNDLILVGITDTSKFFWIDDNNISHHANMGGIDTRWPSKTFHKEFIKFSNQHHLQFNWYQSIKHLDMLSDKLNNRLLQQFVFKPMDTTDILINTVYNFKSIIDKNYSFDNIVDWSDLRNVHGYQHPKVQFHKQFAEHILGVLNEN